ncbi:MAG TPA: hypothetical protein DDZ88_26375 [Verrucomicrobiales bacterium]|nr:hypothetical protein [Verrucomicrobiales bacterium]
MKIETDASRTHLRNKPEVRHGSTREARSDARMSWPVVKAVGLLVASLSLNMPSVPMIGES